MGPLKYAYKLAYIGTGFSGSQAQPGRRTVEGELRSGLIGRGVLGDTARIEFAGRTDAGVHALGQVIAFSPLDARLAEPRIMNSALRDDLWVYARAEVPDDFDPRRAASGRAYRYLLYAPDADQGCMAEASRRFAGTHDFTNFSSVEPGRSPVRTIRRISIERHGDLYAIDVEADSFLWNMVRKIVTGLGLVGTGERPGEWIGQMLEPSAHREGVPPAPAAGLYLLRVDYPGVGFVDEAYSRSRAYRRLRREYAGQLTLAEVYGAFREAMR